MPILSSPFSLDCGYELKDLNKSHVERESLEKELALEKELMEYEKQLPPLVTNGKVLLSSDLLSLLRRIISSFKGYHNDVGAW